MGVAGVWRCCSGALALLSRLGLVHKTLPVRTDVTVALVPCC